MYVRRLPHLLLRCRSPRRAQAQRLVLGNKQRRQRSGALQTPTRPCVLPAASASKPG